LTLARIAFAFTVSAHIIFPAFSIGLASFLAVLNGRCLATGRVVFLDLFNHWTTIVVVAFGILAHTAHASRVFGGKVHGVGGLSLMRTPRARRPLAVRLGWFLASWAGSVVGSAPMRWRQRVMDERSSGGR
jgi:hypothetical protein